METRAYRIPGLYELRIAPHRGGTVIPVSLALWVRWVVSAATRAGLDARHALVEGDLLWLIAHSPSGRAEPIRRFARWVPLVEARALRSVAAYASTLEALRRRGESLGDRALAVGLNGPALRRLGDLPILAPADR